MTASKPASVCYRPEPDGNPQAECKSRFQRHIRASLVEKVLDQSGLGRCDPPNCSTLPSEPRKLRGEQFCCRYRWYGPLWKFRSQRIFRRWRSESLSEQVVHHDASNFAAATFSDACLASRSGRIGIVSFLGTPGGWSPIRKIRAAGNHLSRSSCLRPDVFDDSCQIKFLRFRDCSNSRPGPIGRTVLSKYLLVKNRIADRKSAPQWSSELRSSHTAFQTGRMRARM